MVIFWASISPRLFPSPSTHQSPPSHLIWVFVFAKISLGSSWLLSHHEVCYEMSVAGPQNWFLTLLSLPNSLNSAQPAPGLGRSCLHSRQPCPPPDTPSSVWTVREAGWEIISAPFPLF